MKKLVLMFAAVGVLFTACNNKEIDVVYDDHSADLVGTWTYISENYAEALIINADGSAVSYGVEDGEYWENVKGTVITKDGNITMTFEDNDNFTGHFDIIPGKSFSLFEDSGERYIYQYCENDLSDEIIGMWVCNDGPTTAMGDMMIQIFNEDGSTIMTGHADEILVNDKSTTYKVVGDLVFLTMNKESVTYQPFKMTYSPNGTAYGDVMTLTLAVNNAIIAPTTTWLRVKQNLNLNNGKVYDYSSAYVTNAKGKDEDFSIVGNTFNMAEIKAGNFDMMFRSVLYCVEFGANSIKQNFLVNGVHADFDTPITVEGNKVTLDLSVANPAYRKVDMYMFQDADDSQLHIYMPTKSFINYFANLEIVTMLSEGKIDATDVAAIEKVYTNMEARVESINVSFVLKARK